MRIVVNDIAASKTGALSILKDFYSYIKEHGKNHEWIFLLCEPFLEETDNIKIITLPEIKKRKNRLIFDLWTGEEYIRRLNPDVLFSLMNTLPRGYKGKQVVYVHQPLGYQKTKNFSLFKTSEREYALYQHVIGRMIDSSVKRSDKTIVQTKWMQDAVAEKTGVSRNKVIRILPDLEDVSYLIKEGIRKGNRFVYPSGEILYKNHICIIRAIEILRSRKICDFDVSVTLDKSTLEKLCPNENYSNITCLGRVEREKLLSMYNEKILIFPSYIETFGYPLIEARGMKDVVLASDCPFGREILDGYKEAYFFDPFNPMELADLMERCITGNIRVNENIEDSLYADCADSSWGQVLKELTTWN